MDDARGLRFAVMTMIDFNIFVTFAKEEMDNYVGDQACNSCG